MKHLAFLLLFFYKLGFTQNLITNGSFEDHMSCPFGDLEAAPPWLIGSDLPAHLFDSCSNSFNVFYGVPINANNSLGYQLPRTGHAYVGFNVYSESYPNTREYIKYPFVQNLNTGKVYCLTFYLNLANPSRYGVDGIGAYFTDSSLFCSQLSCILNYVPQVSNPTGNIIMDTLGWTKISGCFTAKGNEKFMIIGNFLPDSITQKDTNRYIPVWDYSTAYLIDDVSLYEESDSIEIGDKSSLIFPNVFSPNNDGLNDLFIADAKSIVTFSCKIYNRYGVLVNTIKDLNSSWDGHNTSGVALPEGVYYYQANAKGKDEKEYNLKGFVSLLR